MIGDTLRSHPFFLNLEGGNRFCLLHAIDASDKGAVLYVHPLAEEMNKSRRMAALQSRALAGAGFAVLQMDLLGCGDSGGDFGDASWNAWLTDVQQASEWLRSETGHVPVLWGLRAGCLLAATAASRMPGRTELVLWQPVLSGRQHLQQFLRLKVATRLLDASNEDRWGTKELQGRLDAGDVIEVAGYRLSPALATGLGSAELAAPDEPARVAWLEVASGDDARISPAAAARIAAWRTAGHDVTSQSVSGLPFWQTQEIAEVPELIAVTTAKVMEWRS